MTMTAPTAQGKSETMFLSNFNLATVGVPVSAGAYWCFILFQTLLVWLGPVAVNDPRVCIHDRGLEPWDCSIDR